MRGCASRDWGPWLAEGLQALVGDVLRLNMSLAFVPLAAPQRLSSAACARPSLLSPAVTPVWRHLPPPSRMVRLLAGLGPGSRPPLPPASEQQLGVPPGGLPVAGREELLHRRGCNSRNPADDLNLGL